MIVFHVLKYLLSRGAHGPYESQEQEQCRENECEDTHSITPPLYARELPGRGESLAEPLEILSVGEGNPVARMTSILLRIHKTCRVLEVEGMVVLHTYRPLDEGSLLPFSVISEERFEAVDGRRSVKDMLEVELSIAYIRDWSEEEGVSPERLLHTSVVEDTQEFL